MTKLSVNINKIATLRNARGGNLPDPIEAARHIQECGAHGITVHPRPDERHIRRQDVYNLKPIITTEFNIEGFPNDDFWALVNKVQPEQITLVPDPPHVLTSNAGWQVQSQKAFLERTLTQRPQNSRLSVFVEPATCQKSDLEILKALGVDRIELYTEGYAQAFNKQDAKHLEETFKNYQRLYEEALSLGLGVNAGHDLNQSNLKAFIRRFPEVCEVSIGHALISEALYEGLAETLKKYLKILNS